MAETLILGLNLGAARTGYADLRAQLLDETGASVGAAVSTGFVEVGDGFYTWYYAAFPDDFRGSVKFYRDSVPATVLGSIPLNPGEAIPTPIEMHAEITEVRLPR